MSNAFSRTHDYPLSQKTLFGNEHLYRRLARMGHWSSQSRILEIGAADGAIFWAQALGCEAVVVDGHPSRVKALADQVKKSGLVDQIEVREALPSALPYGEGDFDGIVSLGHPFAPLLHVLSSFRRFLAMEGRIALTQPVSSRRGIAGAQTPRHWGALSSPAEALRCLYVAGFEPEDAICSSPQELQAFYASLEQAQAVDENEADALRQERRAFEGQPEGAWALALLIGRRREPGERPPASRDRG